MTGEERKRNKKATPPAVVVTKPEKLKNHNNFTSVVYLNIFIVYFLKYILTNKICTEFDIWFTAVL